jgi:hypothetical protein
MRLLKTIVKILVLLFLLMVFIFSCTLGHEVYYIYRYQATLERLAGFTFGSPYAFFNGQVHEVAAIDEIVTTGPLALAGARQGDIFLGVATGRPASDYLEFKTGDSSSQITKKLNKARGKEAIPIVLLRPATKDFHTTYSKVVIDFKMP